MFHLEDSTTLYYDTTYNCDKRISSHITGTIVMLAQRLPNAIGISKNISASSSSSSIDILVFHSVRRGRGWLASRASG